MLLNLWYLTNKLYLDLYVKQLSWCFKNNSKSELSDASILYHYAFSRKMSPCASLSTWQRWTRPPKFLVNTCSISSPTHPSPFPSLSWIDCNQQPFSQSLAASPELAQQEVVGGGGRPALTRPLSASQSRKFRRWRWWEDCCPETMISGQLHNGFLLTDFWWKVWKISEAGNVMM